MPEIIASDGIQLYYEVRGSGPVDVLLLHGMGTSDVWRPLLARLDFAALRVVTCDWRGHGQSGGGAERLTYPQLNKDLLTIANTIGITSCVVVGFSGGCKNAVWLAAQRPERVRGLVLVAPPGLGVVPLPRETIAYFFDALERQKTIPPEFEAWFSEKIGEERTPVIHAFAATPRPVLDATAELWIYTSVVEQARRVTQPVLVAAAGRDMVYHPEYQRQTTLTTLPQARMEVFDCAHFVPCEEPMALAASIKRFCSALPSDVARSRNDPWPVREVR